MLHSDEGRLIIILGRGFENLFTIESNSIIFMINHNWSLLANFPIVVLIIVDVRARARARVQKRGAWIHASISGGGGSKNGRTEKGSGY